MKINKDLNWKKFFFRLTIVLSSIAFIIGGNIDTYGDLFVLLHGIVVASSVWALYFAIWALYFAIRWIYKGLQHQDK